MPSWLTGCAGGGASVFTTGTTYYLPPMGCSRAIVRPEAALQAIARDSYTWANLFVRVTANAATADTVVSSRVDGANGSQSVTIPAGTTGTFEDTVNSDSLVDGSLFNSQLVVGAGGDITLGVIFYTLSTVSNTTPILCTADANRIWYSTVVAHARIGGALYPTDETNVLYIVWAATTLSNLRVYVHASDSSQSSVVRTRINQANGNLLVTITAGTTGSFEDTINTDSVSVGQTLNYILGPVLLAGTGSCFFTLLQMKSTSTGRQLVVGYAHGGSIAFAVTRYGAVESGTYPTAAGTESNIQTEAQIAFTLANLFARANTNTLDGATTVRSRKNTANGNLLISIGAGLTGSFEDTTNSDSIVATDLVNYQVVSGGTVGSITLNIMGSELQQPVGQPYISRVQRVMGMRTWGGIG